MNNEFLDPIELSIKVAIVSSVLVFFSGMIVGKFMARKKFPGKIVLETIFLLPIVLPPSVVGFLLIIIFGKNSVVGQAVEWLFHQPIIFTWWAAVIAASVVAFPLMYQAVKTGLESVHSEIEDASRVDGANEWQVLRYISFPLASKAIVSGIILSFTRALGEFGATLMVAGNIPGKTQTIPTAIYVAMDSGNLELAWKFVLLMISISFLLLFTVKQISKRIE